MRKDPDNASIIEWDQQGLALQIRDKQRLMKEVLPCYFRHSNYDSLMRQVGMDGCSLICMDSSGSGNQNSRDSLILTSKEKGKTYSNSSVAKTNTKRVGLNSRRRQFLLFNLRTKTQALLHPR